MNMPIATSIPEQHWLRKFNKLVNSSYFTYAPNTQNITIVYGIFTEIPSKTLSYGDNLRLYSGYLSCMGYPLDIASMLKFNTAYYPNAGINGLDVTDNSFNTPYNISIAIAYHQKAVDMLIEAACNWDFEIEEMFHVDSTFIFTGKTTKWFYTKWKLQALLHLYRAGYCGTITRQNFEGDGFKHIPQLYELSKLQIPNVPHLTLYNVEDVAAIDRDNEIDVETFDLKHISELSQNLYATNSHTYGIAEFAKPLLKYIKNNPFTKITTGMLLKIRSRHPSHAVLRRKIRTGDKRIVLRLGSTSIVEGATHEINTPEAVRNSANKGLMKAKFTEHNVRTAKYIFATNEAQLTEWISNNNFGDKKLIIKSLTGSRGRGLYLVQNGTEALEWFRSHGYGNHIIEKYYNYNREYRLHISKNGCFYTNRKMLREDAQERWYRNDNNCTWILETNPKFNKPTNWDVIVEECVKALKAVGLDIGACDVRVASSTNDFIICEINSAPSFGEITAQRYEAELNRLIQQLD